MPKRKPGKKSAAELAVAPLHADSTPIRPNAQTGLTGRAAAVYRAVVASFPAKHFTPGEEPQLIAYARHVERSERIERMIDDHDGDDLAELDRLCRMAERESRVALALARTLRLTQQARRQPVSAGRAVQDDRAPVVDFSRMRGKQNG